jgi:SAM-dependent methyltransferase
MRRVVRKWASRGAGEVGGDVPAGLRCPRCGAALTGAEVVMARDRVTGAAVPVVMCRACGVAATHPPPAPTRAATAWVPRGSLQRTAAELILRAELRPLTDVLEVGASLLDLGSGSGIRAESLVGRGYAVTAVEPDRREAAAARMRLAGRAPVIESTIEELPSELAMFGGALMSHVLEHTGDPDGSLRAIRRRLRPGGILAVMVPNARSIEARAFHGRWHGWEPARHRWHFTARGLVQMLSGAGFVDVDVRAEGGWRYPASLAYSVAPGLDPQVAAGWRTLAGRVLALVLAPVARAEVATGRGPQLVATARAPQA